MQNLIHSNCEIEYYDKLSKKMSIWNLAPKKWVYAERGGFLLFEFWRTGVAGWNHLPLLLTGQWMNNKESRGKKRGRRGEREGFLCWAPPPGNFPELLVPTWKGDEGGERHAWADRSRDVNLSEEDDCWNSVANVSLCGQPLQSENSMIKEEWSMQMSCCTGGDRRNRFTPASFRILWDSEGF